MLKKYKKNGKEGFKSFTHFIESVPANKREGVILNSYLDDPIYTSYILKNIMDFSYIFSLKKDDTLAILNNLPNPLEGSITAFYKLGEFVQKLSEVFPPSMYEEYIDLLEHRKSVANGIRETSQIKIVEVTRALQKSKVLPPFDWHFPPDNILKEDLPLPKYGEVTCQFDNGVVAMNGYVENKMREGEWEFYTDEGNIYAKGEYHNGLKTGLWRLWSYNGEIRAKGNYVEDYKSGQWTEWDNERKKHFFEYSNGLKVA